MKVWYPTYVQSKWDIATYLYLAKRIINLSVELSTRIGLAINFDLVWWKVYTTKYNGNIKKGLLSKRYTEIARRFHGVFKKETSTPWCL